MISKVLENISSEIEALIDFQACERGGRERGRSRRRRRGRRRAEERNDDFDGEQAESVKGKITN